MKRVIVLGAIALLLALASQGGALAFQSPVSPLPVAPKPERVPDDPDEYLAWCAAHCQADYGGTAQYGDCVRYCRATARGKCTGACARFDPPQPTPKPKQYAPMPTATPEPTPTMIPTETPAPHVVANENANEGGVP